MRVKPCDRRPQEIIYLQSWVTKEVLVDWRSANAVAIHKKSQKEHLGSYRPDSLLLVPGKVMDHPKCHHMV